MRILILKYSKRFDFVGARLRTAIPFCRVAVEPLFDPADIRHFALNYLYYNVLIVEAGPETLILVKDVRHKFPLRTIIVLGNSTISYKDNPSARYLAAGADDYITNLDELTIRVEACVRRRAGFSSNIWATSQLLYYPLFGIVTTLDKKALHFSPQRGVFFSVLIASGQRPSSGKNLRDAIYWDNERSIRCVDVQLFLLRKLFRKSSLCPSPLETHGHWGYTIRN